MRAPLRRSLAALIALLLCLGVAAACGKKNEPEPPGGPDKAVGRPYPRS